MKKLVLGIVGINQKQWANFVLELNLMKKAWKRYGVDVKIVGKNVKKIIEWGNKTGEYSRQFGQDSESLEQNKRSKV